MDNIGQKKTWKNLDIIGKIGPLKKLHKNGRKWTKMDNIGQNWKNRKIWTILDKIGQLRKLDNYGQKWTILDENRTKYKNGTEWNKEKCQMKNNSNL